MSIDETAEDHQTNAEKLAANNAATNLTTVKSVSTHNAENKIPTIWSLQESKIQSTSAASLPNQVYDSFSTAIDYDLGTVTNDNDNFDSKEDNQVPHLLVITGSVLAWNAISNYPSLIMLIISIL